LSDAVQWHVDNIVVPAGFLELCRHSWTRMVLKPSNFLMTAHDRASARDELKKRASEASFVEDSPNSWLACFYDGVSRNDAALDYLLHLPRI
jgi:hypothetical protein